VFASLIKNGKTTTTAWCAHHAELAGLEDSHGYALAEKEDTTERRRLENAPRCPTCDCSQRDFERQGRFGCPACYTTFVGLLPSLLGRMHRDVDHRGKIPLRGADSATVRHRLAVLQEDLNDAVREEKFEFAAQTRDAIASLKAKLLIVQTATSEHSTSGAVLAGERKQDAAALPPSSTPLPGV